MAESAGDTKPVRWGVLGTAKIARKKMMPALRSSASAHLCALASRNSDRAATTAETHGVPTAYGDYADLLADPEIEAVYVSLPNHLHARWTIEALQAGKHVLCEKPLGVDADDARAVAAASREHPEPVCMEGFMYRFHPQWSTVLEIVRSGRLGKIGSVSTHFSYHNLDPDNVRNQPELGGGALLDVGCYGVSVARWLFDARPRRVQAVMHEDPRFGIDWLTTAVLEFDAGAATLVSSTQLSRHQRVEIVGDEGRLVLETPFNPPEDSPAEVRIQDESGTEELQAGPSDQFRLQAEALARAIRSGAGSPIPLEDSVENMMVLDSIRAAAKDVIG